MAPLDIDIDNSEEVKQPSIAVVTYQSDLQYITSQFSLILQQPVLYYTVQAALMVI